MAIRLMEATLANYQRHRRLGVCFHLYDGHCSLSSLDRIAGYQVFCFLRNRIANSVSFPGKWAGAYLEEYLNWAVPEAATLIGSRATMVSLRICWIEQIIQQLRDKQAGIV